MTDRRAPVRVRVKGPCELCGVAKSHRRGLCWTCYRKLREANLPLPLRVTDRKGDPVEAWATALPMEAIAKLLAVLRARRKQLTQAARLARAMARAKAAVVPLEAAIRSGELASEIARRKRARAGDSPVAA